MKCPGCCQLDRNSVNERVVLISRVESRLTDSPLSMRYDTNSARFTLGLDFLIKTGRNRPHSRNPQQSERPNNWAPRDYGFGLSGEAVADSRARATM